MEEGQSIEEGNGGMNVSDTGALREATRNSRSRESILRSRLDRIKHALAAAQAAARHSQVEVDALLRRMESVITEADAEGFISEIERLSHQTDPSVIFNFQELSGRSLLHIAADANKDDILELLLHYVPNLFITAQDDWGDTLLHVAVKARAHKAAAILIQRAAMLHFEVKKRILRMRNKQGNTALHEAMLNNHFPLVIDLLKEDLEPVYWKNTDHKSPLYLALDTSNSLKYKVFFSSLIEPLKIQGLSPIHGAILRSDYGLVDKILTKNMGLFTMTDSGGGNVFHLAAYTNQTKVFGFLRPETEYLARKKDMNGDLPIHIASKMGHVELIKKLHPVSELLNGQSQSVLHVAAKYGRASTVRYILRHLDLGKQINRRDHYGNSPLHLAALYSQPAALIHLVLDERINSFLLNHKKLTAIDIALTHVRNKSTFRKLLAFTVLESASAVSTDLILQKPEAREKEFPRFSLHKNLTKEVINSRLLVAVLVATVTFTAGFTVPGGFNSTESAPKYDPGMATMLDRRMFQAFVICDTVAMFCSMTAVVNLMMAQQSDLRKAITAFQHTILPLAIALPAMSGAFLTGVTLTVGKLPWLAYTIFALGVFGFLIVSGATLLEYPYFYRGHYRPIRIMTSWLTLAYINLWGVETDISGDLEEEDHGKKKLH